MTIDIEKAKARALVERFKKYSDRPDFFGPITEQESDDAIDTIDALLAEVERLNSPVVLSEWQKLVTERDALIAEVRDCRAVERVHGIV